MILEFVQLITISNVDDWKNKYNEAINKLDQLYQEEEQLYYTMYTQGEENNRLEEIHKIKHGLMTNESLKETLTYWKEFFIEEPIWHRRINVFLSKMKQESLDSNPELLEIQQRLQSNLLNSTFFVEEKEYNLSSVHSNVMENPNRELREQLLLGAKEIGKANEELFRALIQKRNKLAREIGYDNYYHFRCELKEIKIDTYFEEMNAILEKSIDSSNYWDNRIKEKFGWDKIHYYDQYYSTFNFNRVENNSFTSDRLKEVLMDVATSLGVLISQVPISMDSIEIPYGGFCININPNDIKLVVNKRDSYSAFLSGIHELGHAIDGHYASYQYPELYRFYSSIAAEGIAELFQTIITDKEFLMKNFDILEEECAQIIEMNQFMDIKMVKINHYYSLVEYELYNNPERSFQDVANDCYKRVFGYEGTTIHPASEMFFVENPAFFQDYNFALAIRDMIRNKQKIKSLYGKVEVFQEVLEKVIKPNQLYSWHERLEQLCGEPFTFINLEKTLMKTPIN